MTITPKQLASLPKYAREYIAGLEADVRTLREERTRIDAGDSDVFIGGTAGEPIALPPGSSIDFIAGSEKYSVRVIPAAGAESVLEVTATTTVSSQLLIRTRAANAIWLDQQPL
jgi:hypothetical protein